jgi:hypothetical protein
MKSMTASFVVLLCCIFSAPLLAQETISQEKRVTYEAGINIATVRPPMPEMLFGQNGLEAFFCNGIYFRFLKNKNGFRASLNYYQQVQNYEDMNYIDAVDVFASSMYYGPQYRIFKAVEAKLGFQHLFSKNRVSPYFLTDLRFQKGTEEGNNYCSTCFHVMDDGLWGSYRYSTLVAGGTYGIGLRWLLGKAFTLNVESDLQLYFMQRTNLKYQREKREVVNWTFEPLRLAMGVRF